MPIIDIMMYLHHDVDLPSVESVSLVSIDELSRLLSIPKGTLYNWVYLRRIPFFKAGRSLRFDPREVLASLPHCQSTMELADQR